MFESYLGKVPIFRDSQKIIPFKLKTSFFILY